MRQSLGSTADLHDTMTSVGRSLESSEGSFMLMAGAAPVEALHTGECCFLMVGQLPSRGEHPTRENHSNILYHGPDQVKQE